MLPVLVGLDARIMAPASPVGWGRRKWASYRWLMRHRAELRDRRGAEFDPALRQGHGLRGAHPTSLPSPSRPGFRSPAR